MWSQSGPSGGQQVQFNTTSSQNIAGSPNLGNKKVKLWRDESRKRNNNKIARG